MSIPVKRVAAAVAASLIVVGLASSAACSSSCSSNKESSSLPAVDASAEAGWNDGSDGAAGRRADAKGDRRDEAQYDADPDFPPADALARDQAWLVDPNIWSRVPGSEFTEPGCQLWQADPARLGFPKVEWKACADGGPGCEEADVVQGYGSDLYFSTMSTHRDGLGEHPYLAGGHTIKIDFRGLGPNRTIQLDTGISVDAFMEDVVLDGKYAQCTTGSSEESALTRFVSGNTGGSSPKEYWLIGSSSVPGRAGVWNVPWRPQSELSARSAFDIDYAGGIQVFLGGASVAAMLTPGSSDTTLLSSSEAPVRGAGEGDLAIWADRPLQEKPRIRGWTPDGGVRTIIPDMAVPTGSVAISSTHLAGFSGKPSTDGWLVEPQLWATPRAYAPTEVQLTTSPPFSTVRHIVLKMVTWGDFVAANVRAEDAPLDAHNMPIWHLVVARISDWKIRRLLPATGYPVDSQAFTLTETHLYVAYSAANDWRIKTVYRYALSNLNEFTQPP